MNTIYEHSYFHIIAADDVNADSGLLGLGPRTINQITREVWPCLNSVVDYAIVDALEERLRFSALGNFISNDANSAPTAICFITNT
ncbi:hypothetical protein F4680DRAFT_422098 [Xylaria scruposa]|nr:hypothetical protein F4680DRAFT_422098 [Xylaria scruposa]